jgi:hypothetical protein
MSLNEKIDQLEAQISRRVGQAIREVRDEARRRIDEGQQDLLRRLEELSAEPPEGLVSEADLAGVAEDAGAESRAQAQGELVRALAALDRGRSQAQVLEALLAEAGRFASRTALFLTRAEGARLWGSHGWGDAEGALAGVEMGYGGGAWAELVSGGGTATLGSTDRADLASRVESEVPHEAVLVPLVLRDRLAAALYADRTDEDGRLEVAPLQALTWATALVIESLAFRDRDSTPTLARAGEPGAAGLALPLWDAPAGAAPAAGEIEAEDAAEPAEDAAEPAMEMEAEPAAEDEVAAEAEIGAEGLPGIEDYPGWARQEEPAEEPGDDAAWSLDQDLEADLDGEPLEVEEDAGAGEIAEPDDGDAYELEIEEADEVEALEVEADEAAGDEEDESGERESPWRVEAAAEPAAEEPAEDEPEAEAGDGGWGAAATEPEAEAAPGWAPAAVDGSTRQLDVVDSGTAPIPSPGSETVHIDRATLDEQVAAAAAPDSAPAPDERDETQPGLSRDAGEPGASPQVMPPSDVQGPGWAFSSSGEPGGDDRAAHEEARRLARLLVSEIRLYNEEQVEEGRRNRDIYDRLRDDIERSRQMYEERIDDRVRGTTDYFDQELVRILAAGDDDALGA